MNSKPTISVRKAHGTITAREAHGAPTRRATGPAREPRVRGPGDIHTVRAWLRHRTGDGWTGMEWLYVEYIADMATIDLGKIICKSTIGRAIRLEYPHAQSRTIREIIDVGPWESKSIRKQYNVQSFKWGVNDWI